MPFQFRLRAFLKLRQLDRDRQRQALLNARTNLSKQLADLDRLVNERATIIDDLREMNNRDAWVVDQVLERKRHAEQLGQAILLKEAVVNDARIQLENCLAQLVKADQSVKTLERLSERQNEDYQDSQQTLAALNGFPV